MRKNLFIATLLVILVIFTVGLFGCTPQSSTVPASSLTANGTPASSSVQQPMLPTIADVVTKVKPSVVAINVEVTTYDFFNRPVQAQGAGSGWIISNDGYIVTDNHVVGGATNIVVILSDGRTFPADKVYTDPVTDLAIVKINAQNLPALSTGDFSNLNVGDWVVAIGNALGQGIGATKGIVSALGISLSENPGQTLHNLVQTEPLLIQAIVAAHWLTWRDR